MIFKIFKTSLICFFCSFAVASAESSNNSSEKSSGLKKPAPSFSAENISKPAASESEDLLKPGPPELPVEKAPLSQEKKVRLSAGAGLGYSLLNTAVGALGLELEAPFKKYHPDLKWRVSINGGGASWFEVEAGRSYRLELKNDPYIAFYTGPVRHFKHLNLSGSFSLGAFYSEFLGLRGLSVISVSQPVFSGKAVVELNIGSPGFVFPAYFVISVKVFFAEL